MLVATDGQHDMPMLDNAQIPLITPGQRARVSEAWVDNLLMRCEKTIRLFPLSGCGQGRSIKKPRCDAP